MAPQTLSRGMNGSEVERLQKDLSAKDISLALTETSTKSPKTQSKHFRRITISQLMELLEPKLALN